MSSSITAFAPGRVNLIGEHTDYNDGLALPFAIGPGVTVQVTPSSGKGISVLARDLDELDGFDIDAPTPAPGWRAFVRGTVAELSAAGYALAGGEVVIHSDLPREAGLSSSAALEVALALALVGAAGLEPPRPLELSRLCSRVENRWVGARTGVLDQLAVLCGQAGHAVRIDFRSLQLQPVSLQLGDWSLVTVDSGTPRNLATSRYNERREECDRILTLLDRSSMRDVVAADLAGLPSPLDRRARHVIEENERVDVVVAALRADDLAAVGDALSASHRSLRDLYDASVPAVEATVASLMHAGAAGARMVGGGFGGQVLALFPPGATLPADALRVTPERAAHLVDRTPRP